LLIYLSVVVDDLDIECIASIPTKTEAPLIVHPDAVLPFATALQGFEPVARRHPQIIQPSCLVQVQQFPSCGSFERAEPTNRFIIEESLCVFALEGADQCAASVSRIA